MRPDSTSCAIRTPLTWVGGISGLMWFPPSSPNLGLCACVGQCVCLFQDLRRLHLKHGTCKGIDIVDYSRSSWMQGNDTTDVFCQRASTNHLEIKTRLLSELSWFLSHRVAPLVWLWHIPKWNLSATVYTSRNKLFCRQNNWFDHVAFIRQWRI